MRYLSGFRGTTQGRAAGFEAGVLLLAACTALVAPAAGTVTVIPNSALLHPGDTISFSGSATGVSTIAVFLLITGPGLDPRGVTLENLNVPAGRGLFTTAPVDLKTGSWTYTWDTSLITGRLGPGNYTIYVLTSPLDRLRSGHSDYSQVNLTVLPGERKAAGSPLSPLLPACAGVAAAVMAAASRRQRS